jgi:FkbM family methyltransferase
MNIVASVETFQKLLKITRIFLGESNVKIIFEFGSRYGEDTIEFAKSFPHAKIFAFECNPNTIETCKERVAEFSNIVLTEKAVSDKDGEVSFFVIDKNRTTTTWEDGNQGASSLLRASGKYPIENYVQTELKVPSISLRTFIVDNEIQSVDIMWIDIQGAELLALKGLFEKISSVNVLHIEVEFFEIYKNQPFFEEIKMYLEQANFTFLGFTHKSEYAADAIFINNKLVSFKKKLFARWLLSNEENRYLKRLKRYLMGI